MAEVFLGCGFHSGSDCVTSGSGPTRVTRRSSDAGRVCLRGLVPASPFRVLVFHLTTFLGKESDDVLATKPVSSSPLRHCA